MQCEVNTFTAVKSILKLRIWFLLHPSLFAIQKRKTTQWQKHLPPISKHRTMAISIVPCEVNTCIAKCNSWSCLIWLLFNSTLIHIQKVDYQVALTSNNGAYPPGETNQVQKYLPLISSNETVVFILCSVRHIHSQKNDLPWKWEIWFLFYTQWQKYLPPTSNNWAKLFQFCNIGQMLEQQSDLTWRWAVWFIQVYIISFTDDSPLAEIFDSHLK